MKRPTFFMKRSDRLIARLRHLLYGVRFSRQVDGQMIMAWTPLPEWFQQFDTRDYHINQIFDIREFYANGGYHHLNFFDSVSKFPDGLPSLQGPEFEAMRPDNFDRAYFLEKTPTVYSGVYLGFQFSDEKKSKNELDAEVREIYASIPHDPVVARILATAKEKMATDKYAALHVRRGDVGEMLKRDLPKLDAGALDPKQLALTLGHYLGRMAPYDFYYPHIERFIRDGYKILFASDSPETFAHFVKKFGAKHFIEADKYVRARHPIQKAFLDFNMLVGASRIVSTGSTYAAFAATLGGAEIANAAIGGTLERLEGFLIEEFCPALAPNASARRVLRDEIVRLSGAKGRRLSDVSPDASGRSDAR